jgi:hypothetical protein
MLSAACRFACESAGGVEAPLRLRRYLGRPREFFQPPTANYNVSTMFSRKIRVEYKADGQRHPCPQKWLDSFSMRNFTNASIFDDTLPVADGLMEIGSRVPLDELKEKM